MYRCPIVLLLHTVQRDGIPVSSGSLRKVSGGEGDEGTHCSPTVSSVGIEQVTKRIGRWCVTFVRAVNRLTKFPQVRCTAFDA